MAANTNSEMQHCTNSYESNWHQLAGSELLQSNVFQNKTSPSSTTDCPNNKCDVFKSYLVKVRSFVKPLLYLIDVGTDGYSAYQHKMNGDIIWAWLTLIFMVLPKIVKCIMTIVAVIKDSENSRLHKILLVLKAICVAPVHLFFLFMANANATLRDHNNEEAARNLYNLQMLEAMLEALPQSYLQIYVMAVKYWQDRPIGLSQLITIASSVISLALTVSTNSYLFAKVPTNAKVAFFLIGIKTVFSRLAIFTGYVFLSLEHAGQNYLLWLLPLVTMLSVSVGVWFTKRFSHYHCCSCVLPLAGDVHYRHNSWGTVIMTWLLTAVYNGFTPTGLLMSVVNFALAVGAVNLYAFQVGLSWCDLVFAHLSTTPTAVSVLINIILIAVPYLRHRISDHWLSSTEDANERILY